jgi:fucose permease
MAEQHSNFRTAPLVASVYLSGFLQGLVLVSFPASSTALKDMHGFTDAQYGAIFLPQVAFAVVGAVGGGALARLMGLKALLWLSLLIVGLSQLLLAATTLLTPSSAFAVIPAGTACLGLGFGLSGAPLNSYPPRFFPAKRDTALVALHTALGLGLAAGPLLVGWAIAVGGWVAFPSLLLAASLTLMAIVMWLRWPDAEQLVAAAEKLTTAAGVEVQRPLTSASFWIFFVIAILYAFAEGTFYNWAVIYLQESKGLPMAVAAASLSAFWVAMVAGRFALSGLACSAFFPLAIGLISIRFDQHVAWVSSMMIAALMVGVGLGAFFIGLLRGQLALEQLYRISSIYPFLVLVLAVVLVRSHATGRHGKSASPGDRGEHARVLNAITE